MRTLMPATEKSLTITTFNTNNKTLCSLSCRPMVLNLGVPLFSPGKRGRGSLAHPAGVQVSCAPASIRGRDGKDTPPNKAPPTDRTRARLKLRCQGTHTCPAPPAWVPQFGRSPVVPGGLPERRLPRRPGSAASWTRRAPGPGTPHTPCAARAADPRGWPPPPPFLRVWPDPPRSVPPRAPRGLASVVPRRVRSGLPHRSGLSLSIAVLSAVSEDSKSKWPSEGPTASG